MRIRFKELTKAEKGKLCLIHQDTCMQGCPLRVFFKRSAICLRDIEKTNIDMTLDIDDKIILLCRNVIDEKGEK